MANHGAGRAVLAARSPCQLVSWRGLLAAAMQPAQNGKPTLAKTPFAM